MHFESWQWALAVAGAFFVGVSKAGISGLGLLFIAIFANIMPTKLASGFMLPLLIFGDIVAVAAYRAHAQWRFLLKLFPWTGVVVVLGYFAMGKIDDRQARLLIGTVILSMVVLHVLRSRRAAAAGEDPAMHHLPVVILTGVLAGFTTLVANAAGPLMAVYLLSARLPKMEYVGTAAVFFLLLNLFKVPFMVDLGLITTNSFGINLALAPVVLAGAWLGRRLVTKIDQKVFEKLVLTLSAVAGLRLLF